MSAKSGIIRVPIMTYLKITSEELHDNIQTIINYTHHNTSIALQNSDFHIHIDK